LNRNVHYINALKESAALTFAELFHENVKPKIHMHNHMVILCIGTDRATGDSLGPLAGHKLKASLSSQVFASVYGTLEKPVHAKNILQTMEFINDKYANPLIIAVDACLGKLESVGFLTIGDGPVCPGAGLCKDLPSVGHTSITGIVNISSGMDFSVLQNTRLHLVMKMAEVIHDGIVLGLDSLQKFEARRKSIV
jgi:putative sporulation protein YyaC